MTLTKLEDVHDADCVIVAVAHDEFKAIKLDGMNRLFKQGAGTKVFIDVKGLYDIKKLNDSGFLWWRL